MLRHETRPHPGTQGVAGRLLAWSPPSFRIPSSIPNSLKWEIDQIPRNRRITHGPGLSGFAVDGIEPGAAVFPNTSPP